MFDFLRGLFDPSGFPARWRCGAWTDQLGWLHIGSDIAIGAAYTAIPLVLAYFVLRRRDLPFPRIFWLFCAFIYSCGMTHFVEALIFWIPVYRLQGLFKLTTALVSWATVLALIPALPKALALPGLARVNAQLQAEIDGRKALEAQLRAKAQQLEATNARLNRFNRLAVGREHRMVELKREVNRLAQAQGQPPPYKLHMARDAAGET